MTNANVSSQSAVRSDAERERARGRLRDRNIDPDRAIGTDLDGRDITVADFYGMLNMIAATEKSGQSPTYALARLALEAGLPSEVADTLFLAYNQQSAEEAGHGDKVFAAAYYAMGGFAPEVDALAVGAGAPGFLQPSEDPTENKKRLGGVAAALGGIETFALSTVFPTVLSLCETWAHPIAQDLTRQVHETVRPEEARHVLIWRYVFHHLIASKGDKVVDFYLGATNSGRENLGAPALARPELMRLLGNAAPTPRQLLGKERLAFA